MATHLKWFLLLAGITLFDSCRTSQLTAPGETATIKGRVKLTTNGYWEPTPPFSGVQVMIEGTSLSAVSDDSGYFSFHNVPTGTYNVRFSKQGYGEIRWMSATIAGGGNADVYWFNSAWTPVMLKVSNMISHLTSLTVSDTLLPGNRQAKYLSARCDLIPDLSRPQYYEGIVAYVSHSKDVSNLPGHYLTSFYYETAGTFAAGYSIDTTSEKAWIPISLNSLNAAGFNSGDSIYVATYGAPYYVSEGIITANGSPVYYPYPFAGDYYDPTIQQPVFTSINQTPSPVIGTKVP